MATLTYHCPHCQSTHEVDESLVGDRVECRECGRPFEAAMPIARPEENGGGRTGGTSHRVGAGQGDVEEEIFRVHPAMARRSPFAFLLLVLAAIAGIAGIVIGTLFQGLVGGAGSGMGLWIAGALLLVGSLLYGFFWWLQTRFTTLIVTDNRTILREGLISRQTSEVRHEDVRNLQVDQGIADRIFGVGRLSISSAGQDDMEVIAVGIPDPERIAAVVRDMQ